MAVMRRLKKFRHLVSNEKNHLLVSHVSVKEFLFNKDLNEKGAHWITKVMEYDIDIKPTKLVRGKGLCELIAEGAKHELLEKVHLPTVLFVSSVDEWYADIAHFSHVWGMPLSFNCQRKEDC